MSELPTIETGVAIPPICKKREVFGMRELLKSMQPGQSFLVGSKAKSISVREQARKAGIKLCIRQCMDGQYRVWKLS